MYLCIYVPEQAGRDILDTLRNISDGTWEGDTHYPLYTIGLIVYILSSLNKPQSYLLLLLVV